jgi:energy-coupling factor transport system substrate-specific component
MLAARVGHRGFLIAAGAGAASFLITGLFLNPVVIWFIPTQVAIAAYAFYVARPVLGPRLSAGRLTGSTWLIAVALGLGLGIVSGIISAPIIVLVFGGITGAGASLITAVLLKSGQGLYKSVLASGLASEPLDKTLQLLVAIFLVMATPRRIRAMFQG